jgi:hypothetical protein
MKHKYYYEDDSKFCATVFIYLRIKQTEIILRGSPLKIGVVCSSKTLSTYKSTWRYNP